MEITDQDTSENFDIRLNKILSQQLEAPKELTKKLKRKIFAFGILFISIIVVTTFFYSIYLHQESLYSDLKLQMETQAQLEKEATKNTEKLLQNNIATLNEALSTVNELKQTVQNQQSQLTTLNEKVLTLERAEKLRNTKNRSRLISVR